MIIILVKNFGTVKQAYNVISNIYLWGSRTRTYIQRLKSI